jgi:hypothetical protein
MGPQIKDKIIISVFLPNEEMEFDRSDEDGFMRSYKNKNDDVVLIVFEKLNLTGVSKIIPGLLINPHFQVAITRFDDMILVFMTKDRPLRIVLKKAQEPQKDFDEDENNECCYEEDKPYAHTNGKWTPCPYCGSKYVTTFMDGTAQCDDCKREYRYLQD